MVYSNWNSYTDHYTTQPMRTLLPFVSFQYLQVSNSLTGSNTASAVQVAISLPEKPAVFSAKVSQSCSFSFASCVTCNLSISNLASLNLNQTLHVSNTNAQNFLKNHKMFQRNDDAFKKVLNNLLYLGKGLSHTIPGHLTKV